MSSKVDFDAYLYPGNSSEFVDALAKPYKKIS